jgi:hypothetical protein
MTYRNGGEGGIRTWRAEKFAVMMVKPNPLIAKGESLPKIILQ